MMSQNNCDDLMDLQDDLQEQMAEIDAKNELFTRVA